VVGEQSLKREAHHDNQGNWVYQHPYLSNLIVLVVAALFTFSVGEIALRLLGKIPGYVPRYSTQAFTWVDKLEVQQRFFTDGEGVFRANPNSGWSEEYRINSDGFRSREFKQYEAKRSKILFVGDSFA